MLTVVYAPRGGQGCTVVTAMLATLDQPAILIDLAGDLPVTVGAPDHRGPGITELLAQGGPFGPDELRAHGLLLGDSPLLVVPRGQVPDDELTDAPWDVLVEVLARGVHRFWVDAGTASPIIELAQRRLLVTRPCFVSLHHALEVHRPSGVITIHEPGRTLGVGDVERTTGAPVLASLPLDPAVARAVDSGLLTSRIPRSAAGPLRQLLEPA